MSRTTQSRRQFLQTTAALAAPCIIPASALGSERAAPSERITVGIVGLGARGFALLEEFLRLPDVQVAAVCDVDSLHYRDREWGRGRAYGREPAKKAIASFYAPDKSGSPATGLQVTSDFREVCSRRDIDAVVVATPDHWHALCTLEALRSGKDVYCEKPVTHTFHEGQLVYREVAKRKAVFQTGSQQRSESVFRRAAELVRNGHIGKVQRVEVGLPPGYDSPQGDSAIKEPPEHLDYDFWCGPSAVLPYMRARHHRWWRGHRAYGGGVLMDWIGHHNDIAHWALDMDELGPQEVEAVDWSFPKTDVYDSPQRYTIRSKYPGDITITISSRYPIGTKFVGEDGWIYVTRGRLQASEARWTKAGFDTGPEKVYDSRGHTKNFIACVKSREQCISPAETAHRSITPGHLGYVSHELKRPLRWDAAKEACVDDDQANTLLHKHAYRKPWTLSEA